MKYSLLFNGFYNILPRYKKTYNTLDRQDKIKCLWKQYQVGRCGAIKA